MLHGKLRCYYNVPGNSLNGRASLSM